MLLRLEIMLATISTNRSSELAQTNKAYTSRVENSRAQTSRRPKTREMRLVTRVMRPTTRLMSGRRSVRVERQPLEVKKEQDEANSVGDDLNDLLSFQYSDAEESSRRWPEFNPERDMKNPIFLEGILFAPTQIVQKAIKQYGMVNMVSIAIARNNKNRVNAKCKNCDWCFLKASINKKAQSISMKKYIDQYTYGQEMHSSFITHKWQAKTYIEQVRADIKRSANSFAQQLDVDFKATNNKMKLWQVKQYALKLLRSSEEKQYGKLWDYARKLKGTNLCIHNINWF